MNFIITSPYFPVNFQNFAHRMKDNGINVLGIGQEPYQQLGPALQNSLTEYFRVNNMEDTEEVKRAVAYLFFKHGPIAGVESHNEHWLGLDAEIRDQFNIEGNKPEDLKKVKYKSEMKKLFKKAGVPVADGYLIKSEEDLQKALDKLGLPVVAKPDLGVGAAATYKLDSEAAVQEFLRVWDGNVAYFVEPYILDGILCTYDGLIDQNGEIVFETGFYYNHPTLELLQDQLDMAYIIEKDLDPKLLEYGRNTVKAFGMKARFFHIEFFKMPDGDYIGLEYNNRLAGGFTVDMYNHAFGIDLYDTYARLVNGEKIEKIPANNKYCIGVTQRYQYDYQNYENEIREKYHDQLKLATPIPKAFVGLMGDHMYILTADDKDQVDDIIDFVHRRK